MTNQQDALRAQLGQLGVWSSALELHGPAEATAAVAAFERLGYRATWVPEGFGSRDAFAFAATTLARSRRMTMATGIANIYARDAMATVGGARTLAESYPGRFVLGIGVSHAPSVARRGGTYGSPVATMRAYLDAMDAAPWNGPAGAPVPPTVLAALGPRMLELAAERADGVHSYFVPVEHTRRAREVLGPGPVLAVHVAGVIDTDRDRARATARLYAARYLLIENYAANLRRLGWADGDLADGGSDRLLDAVVAQGSAAAVMARVREHVQAGADHVCVQLRRLDPMDLCLGDYAELRAESDH